MPKTKLISLFQLTPEICLELLDATKIIFIDATYSNTNQYALACSLEKSLNSNLSHHISPFTIIESLKSLYDKDLDFEVFSMFTNSFDLIENNHNYKKSIETTTKFVAESIQ